MLADTFSQVTTLARITLWPIVVLVVLIFYHRPLSKFLAGLGGRISRVSFAGASVEIVPASEAPPILVSAVTEFMEASAAGNIQSDVVSSLPIAINTTGAEYIKINLRGGGAWLTSRLYIFSIIFSETASIRKIVFVQRSDTGAETFVGVADPLAVADKLGTRFPWLSYALADAELSYRAIQLPSNPRSLVRPFTNPEWAAQLAQLYLNNSLIKRAPNTNADRQRSAEFSYNAILANARPQSILPPPFIPPAERRIPQINGVAPSEGPRAGGTSVAITGEGFGGLKAVRFGNIPAAISSVSGTQIMAVSPPGDGKVTINVVTLAGSSTITDDWVTVPSSDGTLYAEHAAWIRDGQHLLSLTGDAISKVCIEKTSRTKRGDLRDQILREEGDFVAIVDERRQFRRLIDRRAVIERVATEVAESSS